MGKGVAKKGDQISGDSYGSPPVPIVDAVVDNVKVNGQPCAVMNSLGAVHANPPVIGGHQPVIIATSGTVKVGGKAIARIGDPTSCGATVASSSGNVNAG